MKDTKPIGEVINRLEDEMIETEVGSEERSRAVNDYLEAKKVANAEEQMKHDFEKDNRKHELDCAIAKDTKRGRWISGGFMIFGGLLLAIAENWGWLVNKAKSLWSKSKY